jgi:hypothetical protein
MHSNFFIKLFDNIIWMYGGRPQKFKIFEMIMVLLSFKHI